MMYSKILCGAAALALAAGTASGQWSENFDSYAPGSLGTQGGWDGWDGSSGSYGTVTTDQARSAPNSMASAGGCDAVYQLSPVIDSGQWTFTGHIYTPGGMDDNTYWIIQNVYTHDGGTYDWTVQIVLDPFNGTVNEDMAEFYGDGVDDGFTYLDIISDEWVEIRSEFDFDNNYVETYYGGTLLSWGEIDYDEDGDGFRDIQIQNLDLYGPQATAAYHDDLSLEMAGGDPCLDGDANCNGDDAVDTQDFLCYLGLWAAGFNGGTDAGDLDGDGDTDTQDFLIFLGLWAGCQ
jgi:hypothetical protein